MNDEQTIYIVLGSSPGSETSEVYGVFDAAFSDRADAERYVIEQDSAKWRDLYVEEHDLRAASARSADRPSRPA